MDVEKKAEIINKRIMKSAKYKDLEDIRFVDCMYMLVDVLLMENYLSADQELVLIYFVIVTLKMVICVP
jgi:hypothetical protein